jgi:hypothetical protein
MGKRRQLLSLLALSVVATVSDPQDRYQDPLLDREKYAAACPEYRVYSMFRQ